MEKESNNKLLVGAILGGFLGIFGNFFVSSYYRIIDCAYKPSECVVKFVQQDKWIFLTSLLAFTVLYTLLVFMTRYKTWNEFFKIENSDGRLGSYIKVLIICILVIALILLTVFKLYLVVFIVLVVYILALAIVNFLLKK